MAIADMGGAGGAQDAVLANEDWLGAYLKTVKETQKAAKREESKKSARRQSWAALEQPPPPSAGGSPRALLHGDGKGARNAPPNVLSMLRRRVSVALGADEKEQLPGGGGKPAPPLRRRQLNQWASMKYSQEVVPAAGSPPSAPSLGEKAPAAAGCPDLGGAAAAARDGKLSGARPERNGAIAGCDGSHAVVAETLPSLEGDSPQMARDVQEGTLGLTKGGGGGGRSSDCEVTKATATAAAAAAAAVSSPRPPLLRRHSMGARHRSFSFSLPEVVALSGSSFVPSPHLHDTHGPGAAGSPGPLDWEPPQPLSPAAGRGGGGGSGGRGGGGATQPARGGEAKKSPHERKSRLSKWIARSFH